MTERSAALERNTKETRIKLNLALDGQSRVSVKTGFGLADHLLGLTAFWAGFDLALECLGDLEVDAHHSLEDVGLCLGQAFAAALGDKKGIARVGQAKVPMDEALTEVVLDISGRPYLVFLGGELLPPVLAGQEADLWREFFKAFASAARLNLHINLLYGKNGHHLLESACKGLGLALRRAVALERDLTLSTKGSLD